MSRGVRTMRTFSSRSWRIVALVGVVAVIGAACGGGKKEETTGPIKIGVETALSGPSGAFGPPIVNAAKLAVDRINAAGGVLGRQLVLELGDEASDVKTAALVAERLITKDKAAVLISMQSSAARDAIVPIVQRTGALYIYAPLYEGGACLHNMFLLGEVPQQYEPVFPYVMQTLGGNSWYFVGDDYVWPQKTNAQAQKAIEAAGGTVAGQVLVPLGTNEYAEILNKIQTSGAKHILLTLVGTDTEAFIKAWRAFGLNTSTDAITLALTDNQLPSLGPDAEGVYSVFAYFNGLETQQNQSYLKDYVSTFGSAAPQQTTLSEGVYDAIWLWKLAAEKAGSIDPKAVEKALPGTTFNDAPRGAITIDPKTHHISQHIYLVKAGADDKYHLVKDFGEIAPGPQCNF
jgi:urea transport system substrate-binding protein